MRLPRWARAITTDMQCLLRCARLRRLARAPSPAGSADSRSIKHGEDDAFSSSHPGACCVLAGTGRSTAGRGGGGGSGGINFYTDDSPGLKISPVD